ncbi:MAG: VOC family protein [candidate division KSB1 bacterium]|nr:VOC family protein [candidate division KSB1 bacterium]
MRIRYCSLYVKDQERALQFYTHVLGFRVKQDSPAGPYRWLTLVSPEEPDGPELVLEPAAHPIALQYQEALYAEGIPSTALLVEDLRAEWDRLRQAGVRFRSEPQQLPQGPRIALFDDTCGNWIQLVEP